MLNISSVEISVQFQAAPSAMWLSEQNMLHTIQQGHPSFLDFLRSEVNFNPHERNSDYIFLTMRFDWIDILIPSRVEWNEANLNLIDLHDI